MALFFHGEPPILYGGRCLNHRHAHAGCRRCIDTCPTQAIALEGTDPQLDATRCARCGICTQVCPTDSFVPTVDYEKRLRAVVAELPPTPIALVCPAHPTPDVAFAAVSAIVQHHRCLASLSIADLLELNAGGDRPLWLDDSFCTDCPIGVAYNVLVRTVDAARTLLHASGRSPEIHLLSEQPPGADSTLYHPPQFDSAQPSISRRAFFRRLLPKKEDSAPQRVDTLVRRGAPLSMRLPQQVPLSHMRLLAMTRSLTPTTKADLSTACEPFGAVEVDSSRCSACGLCARFCPTGALRFSTYDSCFELAFQTTDCIACNICVVACPEDAVSLKHAATLASLLSDEAQPLTVGELAPCSDCGVPTARRDNELTPRCYACCQGAGRVSAQLDEAGLMKDLLSKLNKSS